MHISRYCNVLRTRNHYVLHSTLHQTFFTIKSEIHQDEFDELISDEFKFDENSQFQSQLMKHKMVVELNDDLEENLATHFATQKEIALKLLLLINRQSEPYASQQEFHQMPKDVLSTILTMIQQEVPQHHLTSIELTYRLERIDFDVKAVIEFTQQVKEYCLKMNLQLCVNLQIDEVITDVTLLQQLINADIDHFQIKMEDQYIHSLEFSKWKMTANHLINSNLKYEFIIDVIVRDIEPESVKVCMERLHQTSLKDPRFKYYFEMEQKQKILNNQELRKVLTMIYTTANDFELDYKSELLRIIQRGGMHCPSASEFFKTIDYNGRIFKCHETVLSEERKVEKNYKLDLPRVYSFVSNKKKNHCCECEIYPVCSGKRCPLRSLANELCIDVIEHYYNCLEYLFL